MIFIVSGVAGCGKSTVGALLATELSLPFFDGDDFHPAANIHKMQSGDALNDSDRTGWLGRLSQEISGWQREGGAVLACSALKESYRQLLIPDEPDQVTWIILHGTQELIETRLKNRKDHFFDAGLLESQFAIFEIPNYGWHFNIERPAESIVNRILELHQTRNEGA